MSENKNCKNLDFSVYDTMETQELEEILRQDAEATDGQESDTEKILYIAGVLASREDENSTGNKAQTAWESFQHDYLPIQGDIEGTTQKRGVMAPWVRRFAAIAAVFVLVVGLSATAVGALGWENVWNVVAKWTKGTFSFVRDGNTEVTEPYTSFPQKYTSLQDALDATNQQGIAVPTWIPDEYTLENLTIDETPFQSVFIANYKNHEKEILITVQSYSEGDPDKIEINENAVEIYKVAGVEYYIFTNNQRLSAAWAKDSYECIIFGDLTLDEIKTMINSIEKG